MTDAAANRESTNALVERIRAGDESAFEALFYAYHEPLCRFACRFVDAPDVAEEIVQEVFLFVWERRESWDVRESAKTYLFSAVRNASVSYLRHEQVVRRHEAETVPLLVQANDNTDEQLASNELVRAVHAAVRRLPHRCQLVFTLHREQGLTYAEIAAVLGISPKTVEVHMGRALKALRKSLAVLRS
jgi:RNA polymerase sigma-70 factor (ECF subfamily)